MAVGVKICGVRTEEEAAVAVECGADYLGFNFWPRSARFIEANEAKRIIDRVDRAIRVIWAVEQAVTDE